VRSTVNKVKPERWVQPNTTGLATDGSESGPLMTIHSKQNRNTRVAAVGSRTDQIAGEGMRAQIDSPYNR